MDPSDFVHPETGRVVKTPEGYFAFVPAPVPSDLALDASTVRLLSAADAALGELSGLGRYLPNPALLIGSYIRREAVSSSRIEGTQAGLSELLLSDLSTDAASTAPDVREVRNYVDAMEYGVRRLGDLPLSLRLVREIHERLMQNVRGQYATPGEFRRSQNWIGPPGSTLATAPYVPPPPDDMWVALGQWERFLHERDTLPTLVQSALVHVQFEAIHPFLDGNGRVGRLLTTLFLIERGRLSQPLLYLSEYIEPHRQEYYDRLRCARSQGEFEEWIQFFLRGIEWTAVRAVRQAGALMDLRERLRRQLTRAPRALALVDVLLVNPYITVRRAQQYLAVSNPTARHAIGVLRDAGVLAELTARSWGRVYVAAEVLRALEGGQAEAAGG